MYWFEEKCSLHLFWFLLQFHNQDLLQRLLAHRWIQKPGLFGLSGTEYMLIATKPVYDIVCIDIILILKLYKRTTFLFYTETRGYFSCYSKYGCTKLGLLINQQALMLLAHTQHTQHLACIFVDKQSYYKKIQRSVTTWLSCVWARIHWQRKLIA